MFPKIKDRISSKLAFFALAGSISLNVFLLYAFIDTGISLSYSRSENDHRKNSAESMLAVINALAKNAERRQIDLMVSQMVKGHLVKSSADELEIDDLTFSFKDNHLEKVGLLSQ